MSFIPWQVWAGLGGLALICLFWWWLTRTLKKQGALQSDLADAEKTVEDVTDANQIRDRLRADPAYADRVRERFTR